MTDSLAMSGFTKLIAELTHHFQTRLEMPAGLVSTIAEELERVIASGSESALNDLAKNLMGLLRAAVNRAPSGAVDAALDLENATYDLKAAHLLGQLGFAQLLAAQAATHVFGDELVEQIRSKRFWPLIEILAELELRNVDIAIQLNVTAETVSRNLHILRELGLTDFQRRGRDVFNFLTPAATAAVAEIRQRQNDVNESVNELEAITNSRDLDLHTFKAVNAAVSAIPLVMRERQVLAPSGTRELECV